MSSDLFWEYFIEIVFEFGFDLDCIRIGWGLEWIWIQILLLHLVWISSGSILEPFWLLSLDSFGTFPNLFLVFCACFHEFLKPFLSLARFSSWFSLMSLLDFLWTPLVSVLSASWVVSTAFLESIQNLFWVASENFILFISILF